MAEQRAARRQDPRSDRRLPPELGGGWIDLGDHDVDHAAEQFVLAGDVLVQRHGHHAQLLRDLPHADALDPVPVRQGYGGLQDALPAQGKSGSSFIDLRRHAANLLSSGATTPRT